MTSADGMGVQSLNHCAVITKPAEEVFEGRNRFAWKASVCFGGRHSGVGGVGGRFWRRTRQLAPSGPLTRTNGQERRGQEPISEQASHTLSKRSPRQTSLQKPQLATAGHTPGVEGRPRMGEFHPRSAGFM